MSKSIYIRPLGKVLQQADLISNAQTEVALRDQSQSKNLRIGEILALRGWLKQETADFFAEQWPILLNQKLKQPLGQYLKQAGLLDDDQILTILSKQRQMGLRFGELAVLHGWIKSTTINFFLEHLSFAQEYSQRHLEEEQATNSHLDDTNFRTEFSGFGEAQPKGYIKIPSYSAQPFANRNSQITKESLFDIAPAAQQHHLEEPIRQTESLENQTSGSEFLSGRKKLQSPTLQTHARGVESPSYANPIESTNGINSILEEKAERTVNWDIVVKEVLLWTGEQPFLTQKLCQLLCDSEVIIPKGEEAARVQDLVQNCLIDNWETQVASEHLQAIRDSVINNKQSDTLWLLRLYQQILEEGEVLVNNSIAQTELLNLGLLAQDGNKLKIANRVYAAVFNKNWVEQELKTKLKPSPLEVAGTTKSKLAPEVPTVKATSNVSSSGDKSLRHIWILLGVISLLVVCFNIFKALEEKLLFIRGNELFHKGEYQRAIAKYNELLNINSNYYQAWTNRGYALSGLQEYKQMQQSCSAANIIEPKAVYAWNCQGEALYNLKQYNEAISNFDKAIALDSKDPVFWINKTESLLALKRPDEAVVTVNQAISLLKQNTNLDNKDLTNRNLSIAFTHKSKAFLQKQEYHQALEANAQALQYDPNYWDAQQSRGIALQGLGRYSEAITQFNQMLNESKLQDYQKAETWYYLGLTLCQSSKSKEARSAFDEALKLKPNYSAAENAKRSCK
ncbi:tetratricopeptide repeat protein [Aetokthonos hydrillicola Thurmond2011]|jgi:tetratricopeptide (TPR) repeat protein|uniref:Tetratricopeptide repeat protein n=1 Tax=Aetokthonos hydrillicola Thurmond2011 TaxID=2712845 RepID=A0AAP5IAU1_9CYAN|nr:tetratricopeptide repeat protein [Aetokthonos hydrillicola]MBO3462058.1 tetratricopeptide repeat protein [Aetokthonos hydrillicola CCALA 1050]MBW4589335.1 tetratricopeptide repeat protein [Aetokthonos hydrillicola CCALA 1050]MDR9898132.1 tetratricopeptide repeat protein [Aetokthonos hydrillicola Thurmond2011]